jgi:RHH-type transcriptional regulator, proline utilization regulon repressor / proline dehydrogenase / delta 1-pyrroline-5-carboxylate dehydrogenase
MNAEALEPIVKDALALACAWQDRANDLLTEEEKAIQAQMQRLMDHPMDKVVLTRMIDQSFRSRDSARVADQVHAILTAHGIPDFFPKVERLLIQMFLGPGRLFPALTVPKMIEKMRESSSRAIISGEADALGAYLERRKQEGVRVNINHLGEALLGEAEARRRLETYIADLGNPAIEYISVKISTIYSQIHPLAFDHTVATLVERLSELYGVAAENHFERGDGSRVPKFVNLDMEEYRDLGITRAAFTQTLDQPRFKHHSAGIVLQAYLPDSFAIQRELTEWARRRVVAGGSPIRLRIVKGANMEMEQVEAALFNWPLATYNSKVETDANYKRMVAYGMRPENIAAVHLGIASHNLFELAFARKLAEARQVTEYFHFEMLEGMADHVRRALTELSSDVLVYAPVARKEEFINAIAYLIRRLDENTAPENFLRHAGHLKTDSKAWHFLQERFLASVTQMEKVADAPNRIQDRSTEDFPEDTGTFHHSQFRNEPDTDWSCPGNRRWAEEIRRRWENGTPLDIPLVVAGKEIFESRQIREYVDLSKIEAQNGASVQVGRVALAGAEDARLAVATAKADPDRWREKTARQRHEILSRAAMEIRRARGRLIGAAAANTGKVFTDADVEVSEAVDFAEYYPFSVRFFDDRPHLRCRGKGVVLIIAPWNFPIAIPCGGMVSALAAGNTVIFKPASAAALVGWELCQCLWRAGVSRHTLQFVPCSGDETGAVLTTDPDVDAIILTGGTETGLRILQARPEVLLAAETGGKNATIVTAMADRDQAVKNVIQSAFGNAGQKCSATSLLILEREVYADARFKARLVDAAGSFKTGSAWRFRNRMGPLVHRPGKDLHRALTSLEPGETWALKPRMIGNNPHLWTPGIKYDVSPGGFTHMTEFFGPLLAVMKADDLDHAIALVHQTGYGLTSGLESLDRREQAHWKGAVRAGNLYINRGTTGAVVLRQPFGGMGKSALGAGIKVGGPNYVTQFMDIEEIAEPPVGPIRRDGTLLRLARQWQLELLWGKHRRHHDDLHQTAVAIQSYLYHHEQIFSRETDYFHLRGQDNFLRYLPAGRVVIRLHENDRLFDVLGRIAAARVAGCTPVISLPAGLHNTVADFLKGPEGKRMVGEAALVRQTDVQLARYLPEIQRIRYAAPDRVPAAVLEAAARTGFYVARAPVRMDGRLELLHYFREQSICDSYHRYGNLGDRGMRD